MSEPEKGGSGDTMRENGRKDTAGLAETGESPTGVSDRTDSAPELGARSGSEAPVGDDGPGTDRMPGSVVGRSQSAAPGFLELIYGVLFDPAVTFRRLAPALPLRPVLIIVTLVNAAAALMGLFTYRAVAPPGFSEWEALGAALMPFVALIGFVWWYLKWVGYGAVLHFIAQLFGGTNGPRATLAVYGLAVLPALFLLPVEALIIGTGLGEVASARLVVPTRLGVFVWSLVLLVIGLREAHALTTGRAVAVVLLPAITVVAFIILMLVLIVLGLSTSMAGTFVPF